MAYNLPTNTTTNYSFGPGILYIGAAGDTPAIDVGGVRSGAELALTREKLEVFQGSPRTLMKQYAVTENVQLTVNGIEWDLQNLAFAMGSTPTTLAPNILTYTDTNSDQAYKFGGMMDVGECAVLFTHRLPAGSTIEIRIWKAQGAGEVTVTFGDDIHEIPYVFRALDPAGGGTGATGWGAQTLPDEGRLCEIVKLH